MEIFCLSLSITYSHYAKSGTWNEPAEDCVAYWGSEKGEKLTISQWNEKTPADGADSLAALGVPPPAP